MVVLEFRVIEPHVLADFVLRHLNLMQIVKTLLILQIELTLILIYLQLVSLL